jgi:hypothetical protein
MMPMSMKFLARSLILGGILVLNFNCALSQQQSQIKPNQISPEKRALISELLEVTEAKKNALAVFNAMLDENEKQMPDIVWQGLLNQKEFQELDAEAKDALRKELLAESERMNKRIRELFSAGIDMARVIEDVSIDLYDKYFTEDEIKDLIVFYKSHTGKKTTEVLPKMFGESMTNTMDAIKPKVLEIVAQLVNEETARVKKELETKKSPAARTPPQSRHRRKP